MKENEVTIRLAEIADADSLRALVDLGGYEADWENSTDGWLVAEVHGDVVACVQLCFGKPVGRLELLHIRNDLNARDRALVVMSIARAGMFALWQAGSEIVTCMVPFEEKGWKRVLKKRFGAQVSNSGNLLSAFLGKFDG